MRRIALVPTTFSFDCYCPVSYYRLMFTLLLLKCRTPANFIVIILRFVPTLTVPLQLAQQNISFRNSLRSTSELPIPTLPNFRRFFALPIPDFRFRKFQILLPHIPDCKAWKSLLSYPEQLSLGRFTVPRYQVGARMLHAFKPSL